MLLQNTFIITGLLFRGFIRADIFMETIICASSFCFLSLSLREKTVINVPNRTA